MILYMIQSLKRLVRQMWVGARPAPSSEALMMTPEDVATFSAQAKIRRENLKRAMETAFASAPPPVVVDEHVRLIDASIGVARAAAEERETSNEDSTMVAGPQIEDADTRPTALLVEEFSVDTQSPTLGDMAGNDPVVVSVSPEAEVVEPEVPATLDADTVEQADFAAAVEPELLEIAARDDVTSDVLTDLLPDAFAAEVVVESAEEPSAPDSLAHEEPIEVPVSDSVEDVAVIGSVMMEAEPPAAIEFPLSDEATAPELEPLCEATVEAEGDVPSSDAMIGGEVEAGDVSADAKPARGKKAAPKKKAAAAPKKKPAAKKKVQTLDDDVWVSDAVAFSLNGSWPEVWIPPVDEAGATRLEEFRTKAAEGVITIWGRSTAEGAWEPIKPTYWKSGAVEPMSFVEGREHVATEGKKSKGKAAAVYSALKVSKAQVEALWSSPTTH